MNINISDIDNYCLICNHEIKKIFNTDVLNKYKVDYFQCLNCNFIQTEKPYWLDEAYSDAITKLDIGIIYRNINFVVFFIIKYSLIFDVFIVSPKMTILIDYYGPFYFLKPKKLLNLV